MKKLGYIALIATLLSQAGGLFLIFKIQQCSIWYEMLHELREKTSGFEKFTLSTAEFKKCKIDDHEFFYKDEMYDYKSAVYTDSTVELLVIKDVRESAVIKKLKRIASNTNDVPNKGRMQLVKSYVANYIFPIINSHKIFRVSEELIFPNLSESTSALNRELTSPPPELI